MSELFCFGLGYSAQALASRAQTWGWRISGTSTSLEGVQRLRLVGYQGYLFDGSSPSEDVHHQIATATHALVSAPPTDAGDPVLLHHADDLAAAPRLAWIGYLSTIGIYGDRQGAWVDEDTEPDPMSDRSRRRLAAERAWLAFADRTGKRIQIFRLAGIYGPGRSAIDALRAGTARRIVKPGQVFNRIHVQDLASALAAGMTGRGMHPIYNVADDEPAPPQEVVAYAAGLIGIAPPPLIGIEEAGLSPMAASFYAENKRVRNQRMKSDLAFALAFPTYREGLAQIARG